MPAKKTAPAALRNESRAQDADKDLKIKEMDLESGWLGKVFGSPKSAPRNVAGTVVIVLVMIAGSGSFLQKENALETWKAIIPIITLILGYMFGKNS